MASPTNLTFPTVAYNSIILNWTPGLGSNNTLIIRKQGSIPTSRTDGTQVYLDNGNAFIDTGLTDNTNYCYALYGTDGTEYTEPLTGCQSTVILGSDCNSLKSLGNNTSGIYAIDPDGSGGNNPFNVYCDMSNDLGGWTDLPNRAYAWYRFENNLEDSGTGNNDASNFGTTFATGKYGSGLSLNSNLYAIAPITKELPVFTVSFWLYKNGTINGDYDSVMKSFSVGANTNSLGLYFSGGADGRMYSLSNNSWKHVVFSFDGSTMKMYIDNSLVASKSGTGTWNISQLDIGRAQWCPGGTCSWYYMNGILDDLRIYEYALSTEDISHLYNITNLGFKYDYDCKSVLANGHSTGSGVYQIDPDGPGGNSPTSAYCDMVTDGGGWTLITNYNSPGGQTPAMNYRTNTFPLLGSSNYVNEVGTSYWGHIALPLLQKMSFTSVRLWGKQSNISRVVSLKLSGATFINSFKTNTGYSNVPYTRLGDDTSLFGTYGIGFGQYSQHWIDFGKCDGVNYCLSFRFNDVGVYYPSWGGYYYDLGVDSHCGWNSSACGSEAASCNCFSSIHRIYVR
jgi:hypothetical protein